MSEGARPEIRYVAIHRPGPAWESALDFSEQAGVDEHAAHYAEALNDGLLERGGPFLDSSGGMMVFAPHVGREAALAVAQADPAVQSGLLLVELKPWMAALSP